MAVTEPPQDAAPAKRPGRPRKAASPEATTPAPRRPGRPRKTPVTSAQPTRAIRRQPEPPSPEDEAAVNELAADLDEPEEKQIVPGQHGGYRPNSGGRKTSASYEALAKARAKNEIFKANLAELEYKQRVGLLLPVEEVSAVWADKVRIAKERLLSIPARVAPAVLRMTELRDVEHHIRDALHAVLEELSRGDSAQP